MLVEGEDRVAQERRRGDVAREQEKADEADDLLVVESLPSTSARTSALVRSSPGRARRSRMCASR
jgi:hypothetical protein